MALFRQAAELKKDAFNFLLVCMDNFSNYLMVEPIRDKQAKSMPEGFAKIVQREGILWAIVYCDKGTEFDNKTFNSHKKVRFWVQFTIHRN